MAEHCARCERRNVVSRTFPEEIKRLALLNRWKTGVCPSRFDEPAEQGRIRYSSEDVSAGVLVRHAGAAAKAQEHAMTGAYEAGRRLCRTMRNSIF